MNKDTEIKVLLQPETDLTESVSGFFFPKPLIYTRNDTRRHTRN